MASSEATILAGGLEFPEGPAFDPDSDLWCVELLGGHLSRVHPREMERHEAGGNPNGLTFDRRGRAWIANAELRAIQRFDPVEREFTTIVGTIDGEPLDRPNDLAFDALGNLLFTCPGSSGEEPTGYVCCLAPDGTLTKIGEGFQFPNGLALTDGGSALVVAETERARLWKGAWDARSRRWSDPRPWADLGDPAGPDGMALGADGLLYVAIYSGGQVRAVAPDGRVVAAYELPGQNPTNAAFDPSGRLGLVVTETEHGQLLSLPQLGPGATLFDGGDAWD
jgi:gluconolactonase